VARQCKLIPEKVAERIRGWVPETPTMSGVPMHSSAHLETAGVGSLVVTHATDSRHCRACGRPVEVGQLVVEFVYWPWINTRYMTDGIPPTVLIHRGKCPYAAAHRTEEVLGQC